MDLLNKLTIKNLKLNKKRTIVTIIGIILSIALISAVFSMFFSFQESMIVYEKELKGDFHAKFIDDPQEDLNVFKNNQKINIFYSSYNVGFAKIESENEYKPYAYISAVKKEDYEKFGFNLISGRMPNNSREIVIPKHLAENGKLKLNIGDTINAIYIENDVIFYSNFYPKIGNIKLIKVIEDNSDNHMTEDDLNYNYYATQLSLSNGKNLAFIVYETNENYPIKNFFSSDIEIKIIKKEENNQKRIVKHYKSSEISYQKHIDERRYKITIDNANYFELEDELEEGKYVLRIENANGNIIKIPFERNPYNFQW